MIVAILDKLMGLDGHVSVLPGHGPESSIAYERTHNPFLQPFNEPGGDDLDWDAEGIELDGTIQQKKRYICQNFKTLRYDFISYLDYWRGPDNQGCAGHLETPGRRREEDSVHRPHRSDELARNYFLLPVQEEFPCLGQIRSRSFIAGLDAILNSHPQYS